MFVVPLTVAEEDPDVKLFQIIEAFSQISGQLCLSRTGPVKGHLQTSYALTNKSKKPFLFKFMFLSCVHQHHQDGQDDGCDLCLFIEMYA